MKCPICGVKGAICECGRTKYMNEIGQLQDELSVSEMSLTQCELRRKQDREEIKRLELALEEWHSGEKLI